MSAIPQATAGLTGDKRGAAAVVGTAAAAASSRARRIVTGASILLLAGGTAAMCAQGGGIKTHVVRWFVPEYGLTVPVVRVISHPVNNERDVRVNSALSFTIKVRNGQLNSKTLATASVLLTKITGGPAVPVILKPAGERDLIVRPAGPLQPDTTYSVTIAGLKTMIGATIQPFVTHFTTGRTPDASIRFQRVTLINTTDTAVTAVAIGPDHKLYAGTDEGVILRYSILPDGHLGVPQRITSLQTAGGAKRLLIGLCFDPAATADDPIIWVSHGYYAFEGAPDFTGKITRMRGHDLEIVEDAVVHLPRSARDHLNNQPSFGPDGALYWPQGSSSSYGGADPIWGNREEHLLNAAILRLDVSRITPGKPLDALTVDAGGSYDPRAADVPLTVYAIGIRNAYDLVWTHKGQLYTAVNGAQAPGNAPAGPGVPALVGIAEDEDDWLFHITPGKYYGHPNPQWNHFVLNGGNPTPGEDFAEIVEYPVGTKPDKDWQPAVYDFGPHVSANGTIEYRSDAFGGKLKDSLIVCRFNAGSDLIDVKLKDDGGVDYTLTGIPGFTNLNAPLDLCEDRTNGNIYVTEYGARCITLLRPVRSAPPTTAP
jgi:glucose/arabinose dehydrogenase